MASRPWTDADRAFLKRLSVRRDWIEDAMNRFPDRSEAAVRCMMQKVRTDLGVNEPDSPTAWMADAKRASRELERRLIETGLRP
jgi:hypothetical protein